MRVGIVGAGMAGLTAARDLKAQGHEVTIFEKSRGVGGRAATRRKDGFIWDTGATVIPEALSPLIDSLEIEGFAKIDRPVWLHEDLVPRPGNPREEGPGYAFPAGITTLAKAMGRDLDVRTETRIETIEPDGEAYRLAGEVFDAVILTAPIPQTLVLLQGLAEDRTLGSVEYRPCLSILLGFDRPLPETPYTFLLSPQGKHPLGWLSLESVKCAGRAPEGGSAMVCQMSEAFSREHYTDDLEALLATATGYVTSLFGSDFAQPVTSDEMRWRYSQPLQTTDFDSVNPTETRIVVASDGLTGGKLQHAVHVGQLAAQRILALG